MTTEFKMVPVELLERVATEANHMLGFTYAANYDECRSAVDELRAMIDAPASPQAAQPADVFEKFARERCPSVYFGKDPSGEYMAMDAQLVRDFWMHGYTHADAGEIERQRKLKMILAERVENAEANCSVYRYQIEEQQALLQLALTMINRGIVSFDDQIEYRQKLAALSTTAKPEVSDVD